MFLSGVLDWGILKPYKFPRECTREIGVNNVAICEQNVNVGFMLAFCSTVLQTLTQAQIFDAYLYLVSNHSNTVVGVGESIVGVTALVIMLPAAAIVDRHDRGKVCDAAAYCAQGAAILSVVSLWMNSIPLLFASMICWGVHWELCNSASDCILVDSLPIQDRTAMITKKTVVQVVSCSIAIAIQLIFFFIFGNTWSVPMCKLILVLGYVSLTPMVMNQLFTLQDRRYIPVTRISEEPSAVENSEHPEPLEISSSDTEASELQKELEDGFSFKLRKPLISKKSFELSDKTLQTSDSFVGDRDAKMISKLTKYQAFVPYLVGLSDFIRAVGAGMTVKFFSLFFMNEYDFSPVNLTLLGIVYNLTIALFTEQANTMALTVGRSMTSVIYQVVSLVLFLVLYHTYSLPWLILIYLVRGAAGNAFSALDRAIVADTTTVKHRGKWMAIESLSHVTWSGSAFIGGLLSDAYDYRTTFLYTSFVYAAALIIYIPVAILYPKRCDQPVCSPKMCDSARNHSISEGPLQGDCTLRITHEALYQSRIMRDSMSMSRARGTSVTAAIALESLLEKEEFDLANQRLTTGDAISRRTNSVANNSSFHLS